MSNISSPFGQNEWLVEEMYRKFRDDPSSVDPSWHEFLVDYNPEPAGE
ncbi:2-oxoglutarate dehydrogenase E1 subunit family protein, partial [Mycobacterium colombiense]